MSTQRADETSPRSSDAVVMGGGWAGLITALRLAEGGKSVMLIEARPRLGGRAFTHTYTSETMGSAARTASDKYDPNVTAVDFGCSWIHGYAEGNPVKLICEKLGIVCKNRRAFSDTLHSADRSFTRPNNFVAACDTRKAEPEPDCGRSWPSFR